MLAAALLIRRLKVLAVKKALEDEANVILEAMSGAVEKSSDHS